MNDRLNIASYQQEAPFIVRESKSTLPVISTQFLWGNQESEWGQLRAPQLNTLTSQIAQSMGITTQQADKIDVIFGDHIVTPVSDHMHINTAYCLAAYTTNGDIEQCRIIINRSKEVAEYSLKNRRISPQEQAYTSLGILNSTDQSENLKCVFESPQEGISWILAEELNHARICMKAGDRKTLEYWQSNYLNSLICAGIVSKLMYSTDLQEVASSRMALKVLKKLSMSHSPHRALYFDSLYKKSLTSHKCVIPTFGKVFDELYIPTGFDPKEAEIV